MNVEAVRGHPRNTRCHLHHRRLRRPSQARRRRRAWKSKHKNVIDPVFLGELERYIGDEHAATMRKRELHFLIAIYCAFNIIFCYRIDWFADIPIFSKQNLGPFAAKTFFVGILLGELIFYLDHSLIKIPRG